MVNNVKIGTTVKTSDIPSATLYQDYVNAVLYSYDPANGFVVQREGNSIIVYYKLPITVKTESATRTYNGEALTAGGSVTGVLAKDQYTFTPTGSQTEVGHSTNTYTLTWGAGSIPSYYTVT